MSNYNKKAIIVKLKISTFIVNNQILFYFLPKCLFSVEHVTYM